MLRKRKERNLANKIKSMLLKRGFIIDMDISKKTGSIYLKIDNGACGTIRISNHRNDKAKSKFNMIKNYTGKRSEFLNGQMKMFYNYGMIGRLIADVEIERSNKIIKYGYSNYKKTRDRELLNDYYIYKQVA